MSGARRVMRDTSTCVPMMRTPSATDVRFARKARGRNIRRIGALARERRYRLRNADPEEFFRGKVSGTAFALRPGVVVIVTTDGRR
jgi:hypothetical protein